MRPRLGNSSLRDVRSSRRDGGLRTGESGKWVVVEGVGCGIDGVTLLGTGERKSHKVLEIVPVAIIDSQLPFEYTITSRSTDVMVDLSVGLILNGLTSDFVGFVRNYNMHNMGKTIGEIHSLVIEYEKGLPKKAKTPQVMAIRSGKIQKANKKSLKAKGSGKANGKGKDKKVYIPKPKNPKPSTKEHLAKDDTCHHYKEVGHWKRNYHVYLAELLKKRSKLALLVLQVIQLVLWIIDSRYLKHMTGNLQLLRNVVEKFIGTVCFGNDHFVAITGYEDYVQGNLMIFHVYYVEGLSHNFPTCYLEDTITMDSITNNKKRKRTDGPKILAETLAKWNEINKDGKAKTRKPPAKGSTKGCMKGKGGPENSKCSFRGVSSVVEGALAYDEAARAIYGPSNEVRESKTAQNNVCEASKSEVDVTGISNDDMLDIDDFLGVMVEYEYSQAQGLKTTQNVSEATAKEVQVTGTPDKNFFDIDELLGDMNQKGQYDAWFENKVDGFDFDFLDTKFEDYNFTLEDLGISLDLAKPVM
nr:zinc finger, CCHC-type [Tanacetum cinerariifolium]